MGKIFRWLENSYSPCLSYEIRWHDKYRPQKPLLTLDLNLRTSKNEKESLIMEEIISLIPFGIVLLLTGGVAGILAGLLGVGGGIVIVPVLYLLFPLVGVNESVVMHLAVGTSLLTIIPTSIMSAKTHYKKGGLDVSLLRSLAPGIVIGVILGTIFGARTNGTVLTAIFGTVALLVSMHMAFKKDNWQLSSTLPTSLFFRGPLGAFIGSFSVLMGIGGGTLSVPILSLYSVPIRRAVGTASAIGIIIAIPGSIGFILSGLGNADLPSYSFGFANLLGFSLIVPATMFTAPIGARIAHSINPDMLRKAFSFFLLLTSLRMLSSVFFS